MRGRGKIGNIVMRNHAKRRRRERQGCVLRLIHHVDAVPLRIIAMHHRASDRKIRGKMNSKSGLVIAAWLSHTVLFLHSSGSESIEHYVFHSERIHLALMELRVGM